MKSRVCCFRMRWQRQRPLPPQVRCRRSIMHLSTPLLSPTSTDVSWAPRLPNSSEVTACQFQCLIIPRRKSDNNVVSRKPIGTTSPATGGAVAPSHLPYRGKARTVARQKHFLLIAKLYTVRYIGGKLESHFHCACANL